MSALTLAVIADTHMPRGARRLPQRCLELCAAADRIVHAGDFSRVAAFEEIAAIGPPLVAVHGNVDERQLRERLPERAALELGGVRIGVIHDAGPSRGRLPRMRRAFPDADAVIFGHSHIPLHERDPQGGFQIFNPGSPTDRRRSPHHTMGMAEIAGGSVEFRHVVLD